MQRPLRIALLLCLPVAHTVLGADWYAAPDGKPDAAGTVKAPWDLESALRGGRKIAPGDTLWLLEGTYKHPDRKLGSQGYVVRLAGEEGKPIHIRAIPRKRVTIDGGLSVQQPSAHLWIRDLEILVSENFAMSRRVEEPGSHPTSYNRPWGGLSVYSGKGSKFINLVIHDNAQGVSWWSGAEGGELHGCIVYDNGWDAPDRGHGHAVYTQNQNGTKVISDCIMTGGYSYTMHAYGSSRAYVDHYLIEGNICYDAGQFLVGGGRPSHNIRVLENYLHGVSMRIGYNAPHNEDCEVRGNVIVGGGLQINNYRQVVREDNLVIGPNDPRPADREALVVVRANRYDPNRANVAIFNWPKSPTTKIPAPAFLKPGDRYRLLNPRDFYGQPVAAGTYQGQPIEAPTPTEFTAFALLRERRT